MKNILHLTINGPPQAKQRSRRGSAGNWYNPQSFEMNRCQRLIKSQLPKNFKMIPKNIPVIVNITWFFKPAKKNSILEDESFYHSQKPDLDNILKFVLDILSKIVFYDDNQVSGGLFRKYDSNNPRTEIEVMW